MPRTLRDIRLDNITPDPDQPRKEFDQEKLQELADSIQASGLLQPISVRKVGADRFVIVAGERRYRAHQLLEKETITAEVMEHQEASQLATLQMIENLQREGLTQLETAYGYRRLMDANNWNQVELAQRMGKSKAHVTQMLYLTEQPDSIQAHVTAGKLSASHVAELSSLAEEERVEMAERVVAEGMSRKELRQTLQAVKPAEPAAGVKPAELGSREELLLKAVQQVRAMPSNRRNTAAIQQAIEQLQGLL